MSNFICSECETNYIDCPGAGYKTPKEIELEKKLDIAIKALNRIYEVCANNTNQFQYIVQYTKRKAKQILKEIDKIKKS